MSKSQLQLSWIQVCETIANHANSMANSSPKHADAINKLAEEFKQMELPSTHDAIKTRLTDFFNCTHTILSR